MIEIRWLYKKSKRDLRRHTCVCPVPGHMAAFATLGPANKKANSRCEPLNLQNCEQNKLLFFRKLPRLGYFVRIMQNRPIPYFRVCGFFKL